MSIRSDIADVPVSVTARADSRTSTMLDRYCGNTSDAAAMDYVLPHKMKHAGLGSIRLIDTDALPAEHAIEPGATMAHWHVLWVRDEPSGSVTLSSASTEHTWPIAPGDTVSIPPGYRLGATGGQLAVAITEARSATIERPPEPPSHGHDQFAGYNRHTTLTRSGSLALVRWKLTEPLDIRQHHAGDLLLVILAGKPAILTGSTVIAPRRGRAVIAPERSEPRVLPNGLSYLLAVAPASKSP